jgi:tricorn protease-like protein
LSLPESGGSTAAITAGSSFTTFLDWLPHGESIVSLRIAEVQRGVTENSVLQMPLSAAPNAESKARLIMSSRSELIDEIRVSPNARWLAFEGIKGGDHPGGATNAALYIVATSAGAWIPITDGTAWDDKPRWSPDGKLIYFVSSRNGFPNVWAIRFDPEQGRPLGQPFPVTSFESPALMVADLSMNSISLSSTRLVLSMTETSGSIWVLDDVDK